MQGIKKYGAEDARTEYTGWNFTIKERKRCSDFGTLLCGWRNAGNSRLCWRFILSCGKSNRDNTGKSLSKNGKLLSVQIPF